MFDSLEQIFFVGHWQAPAHSPVHPTLISSGTEYIEILTNGRVWYEDDGGARRLYGRGTIFWHRGGEHTIHDFPSGEPYGCYVVRFAVGPDAPRLVPHVSCPVNSEALLAFLQEMFQGQHQSLQPNPMAVYSLYTTLAYYALAPQVSDATAHPRPLQAVLAYLERHACEAPTLASLAAVAGVSEDHLHTLFRRHLGTSPHRHVLELRMARAKQMLAGTETSIKRIAAACGFQSLEVFYRQFRRLTETTPAQYRRQYLPK